MMKLFHFRDISIRWKVVALMLALVAVGFLAAAAGLFAHMRSSFEHELIYELTIIGDITASNVTAALELNDGEAAFEKLAILGRDDRILTGAVYNQGGTLFAAYRRPDNAVAPPASAPELTAPVFGRDYLALVRPIERKGQTIGSVYVVADTREWSGTLATYVTGLSALFSVVLAVGFLMSIGLQRLVSRPIEELANVMGRIVRERDYSLRAKKRGNDEIGVLVDGFNNMFEELGHRRADAERAERELKARVSELDAEVRERRRAESALLASREQLRNFIEYANVGMHWVGADGTVLWANRYELDLLGYLPEEYIGRHIGEFHVDRAVAEEILKRFADDDAIENYEVRLRCKDGSIRHVLVNSSTHRENGRFVHTRCFTRDITERKIAEDALRRSEERYRLLVAATTSVVFATDAEGNVTQRLPSWEEYTGQTWEEYSGTGWLEMIHPDDRERLKREWTAALAGGAMFEAEARIWHADSGRHRYCIGRAVPLKRADGAAYEWTGTMTDIDDRKRAEEQFRLAVEGAPTAIIMIDQEGRIVLVNRQLEALFGYRRDELLGEPVERLVPERLRRAHPAYRAEFFGEPRARPMGAGRTLNGRHKDGREVPVEIGLSPFETEEGTFCLASVIDISERRRAEEELRRHTDELTRSNRELGQFAYVASHDLQEPLRAISGCVQLLRQRYKDKLDARANELIEHSVSGALRMQALINDLLSYSRVSTRARPFEVCDLSVPLTQALANLEFSIRESGAIVTNDPMPLASVDPTQLTQLFQNLIGNALKFRAERTPRVHIGVQPGAGGYVFSVQDNGIGIEPQYIDRIFGVFQRLHNRAKYPGNGIGLAICRKIVERHNGRIWVNSTPGEGSAFYFTLPTVTVQNVESSERLSTTHH